MDAKKSRPSIVLAEDENDMRTVLVDGLTAHGFEVRAKTNGKDALLEALRTRTDAILLDVLMPVMNGMDALGLCKILEPLRRVPVFILTALKGKEDVISAMRAGAADYIAKPFNMANVSERVRKHIPPTAPPAPPIFEALRYTASSDGVRLKLHLQSDITDDSLDDLLHFIRSLRPIQPIHIVLDCGAVAKIVDGIVSQMVQLRDLGAASGGVVTIQNFNAGIYGPVATRIIRNIFKVEEGRGSIDESKTISLVSKHDEKSADDPATQFAGFRYDFSIKEDYALVDFKGNLTADVYDKITSAISSAAGTRMAVILRLEGLKAIDFKCMNHLVACIQDVKIKEETQVFVVSKNPHVQQAFRDARGHLVSGLYDSVGRAISAIHAIGKK